MVIANIHQIIQQNIILYYNFSNKAYNTHTCTVACTCNLTLANWYVSLPSLLPSGDSPQPTHFQMKLFIKKTLACD